MFEITGSERYWLALKTVVAFLFVTVETREFDLLVFFAFEALGVV